MLEDIKSLREEVSLNLDQLNFFIREFLPVVKNYLAKIFYGRKIDALIREKKLFLNKNSPLFIMVGAWDSIPNNISYLRIESLEELGEDPGGLINEIVRRGGGNGLIVEMIQIPPLFDNSPIIGRINGEIKIASHNFKNADGIFVGMMGDFLELVDSIKGFAELFVPSNYSDRQKLFNIFLR